MEWRLFMEIIKADNVVYEYIRRDEEGNVEGITRAVNDVSLDIEQGQFIAILGHNGSGKSTLAKHMNAILNPTEGTLWVDGMDTKDEDNIWKVRQTAGMVFQNPDNQIIGQVVEEDEENRFRRPSGSHAETAGTDDERETEQKVVRLPFKIFFCRKPDNDICPAFLSLRQ
jgi:energy-coupling factor transporter ATP-binding protein EcfA2